MPRHPLVSWWSFLSSSLRKLWKLCEFRSKRRVPYELLRVPRGRALLSGEGMNSPDAHPCSIGLTMTSKGKARTAARKTFRESRASARKRYKDARSAAWKTFRADMAAARKAHEEAMKAARSESKSHDGPDDTEFLCQKCRSANMVRVTNDDGKVLKWTCPNCNNTL